MKMNDPKIVAEVASAVEAYDKALVANDIATVDSFFLDRPDTVRYGPQENLYGARAIAAFRAARPAGARPREILKTIVSSYGSDFAIANVEFRLAGDDRLGRQSQSWVRVDGAWRIAGAHVSYMGG